MPFWTWFRSGCSRRTRREQRAALRQPGASRANGGRALEVGVLRGRRQRGAPGVALDGDEPELAERSQRPAGGRGRTGGGERGAQLVAVAQRAVERGRGGPQVGSALGDGGRERALRLA